jgi:hypothetical protein
MVINLLSHWFVLSYLVNADGGMAKDTPSTDRGQDRFCMIVIFATASFAHDKADIDLPQLDPIIIF